MRRRQKHGISQTQIDFLCLAVFGQRALPDDMAARIAGRRELALALARGPFPDPRPPKPEVVEALVAV